jgi:RNA polymerase-binding transcription factor DksA
MSAAPRSDAAGLQVRPGQEPWTTAEHELALTQNAQDLLDQGARALDRIDAGTYGVCESCGQPMGKARLLAFPRATLCVACKQRQERR